MGIDVDRQKRLQDRPQLIRNAESGGGAVIRRSLPLSLFGFLFAQAFYCITVIRIGFNTTAAFILLTERHDV